MNDAAPRTRFIPCIDPTGRREECGSLVLDTDDARRIHRAWHANDKKVKDALREAIRAKDATISELARRIDDTARDVENIDIPIPPDPIEIAEGGWSDDDEPEPDFDDDLDEIDQADDEPSTPAADPMNVHATGITYGPGIVA